MVAFNTFKQVARRHICVYGPPKTGKTSLVGDLAEKGYHIDLLDLESGANVLQQCSSEAQSRINVVPIPDTREFPIAVETVAKIAKFITAKPYKICLDHGKIECPACLKNTEAIWSEIDFAKYTDKHILVIDTANQLSQSTMAQVCKGQEIEFKPGRDEYARQGSILGYIFGNIQNCKYNVIVNTHEVATETTQLEADKTEKIFPLAGTSNFSRTFAKYFDDVVHTEIYSRRHRAVSSTTGVPNVLSGTRSGLKLEDMQNPSLVPFFTGEIPVTTQEDKAKSLLTGMLKK